MINYDNNHETPYSNVINNTNQLLYNIVYLRHEINLFTTGNKLASLAFG